MANKQWTVQIYLADEGDETSARAVLITKGGGRVDGIGRRHRNPADARVPEIGEEVAASRALADLAGKVAAITKQDLAESAAIPAES
ncbi:dsRBD fold-containing protein [Nonomuraea sp. 10N515B]|uniref:dsRBD fold-containing protein n=1 Tax=Nonomuraea sp. 10N515B TaxID=3457422 RepID=UPI003FCCE8EE